MVLLYAVFNNYSMITGQVKIPDVSFRGERARISVQLSLLNYPHLFSDHPPTQFTNPPPPKFPLQPIIATNQQVSFDWPLLYHSFSSTMLPILVLYRTQQKNRVSIVQVFRVLQRLLDQRSKLSIYYKRLIYLTYSDVHIRAMGLNDTIEFLTHPIFAVQTPS